MLACLRDVSCALPPQVPTPRSARQLIHALQYHRVLTTVARQVKEVPDLPPQVGEAVREARFAQAFRQLQINQDVALLQQVFHAHDIPWLVVKGPAVALTVYPEPSLRSYHDLDVLIPREKMGAALDGLTDAGFQLVDRNWPMIAERMGGELTWFMPNGSVLDLHWHLVNAREKREYLRLRMPELFEHLDSVRFGEVDLPVVTHEYRLIHLAIHALTSGAHQLNWLKDIQMVAAAAIDWDEVRRIARRWEVGTQLAVILDRAVTILDAPIPPAVIRDVAGSRSWVRVTHAVTRRWPPQHVQQGGFSGKQVIWASRQSAPRSFLALARGLPAWRTTRGQGELDVNPLHQDVPDTDAKARYLQRLAGTVQP